MGKISKRKIGLLVLLLAAIIIGLWSLPAGQWMNQLQTRVKALGPLGPFAYVLVYIATTLLLIPGSLLTIGAGGIFGFALGLAVVVAGANLGALCAFLLTRSLLRWKVARWAAANPKFAALDRAIGRDGFKMVLLSRLSPVFPFTLLNYMLGLTTVRTGTYVLANLIGMLPGSFLYVYIGVTAHEAISSSSGAPGAWKLLLKIVGLLATIAIVVLITRMAKRAIAQAEENTDTNPQDNPEGF